MTGECLDSKGSTTLNCMLLTRVISALILLPITLALIWLGSWPFYIAMAGLLCVAAYEFNRLMRQGNFQPTLRFSIALVLILVSDGVFPQAQLARPAMAMILIGSLTWQLNHRQGAPVADWALTIASGLYLGVVGAHVVELRQLDNGERWLLLTLTGTWLADSGAYLIGSRFGRRKMAPTLSSKKSWEGFGGGVVSGVGLNAIAALLLGLPPLHGAVLGLIGATIGTLGDLSISMIKRQVGAKDSGRLIPGHGGMLDRLDSLMFSVIAGYYYIVWIARP